MIDDIDRWPTPYEISRAVERLQGGDLVLHVVRQVLQDIARERRTLTGGTNAVQGHAPSSGAGEP